MTDNTPSLWHITEDLQRLEQLIEDNAGELSTANEDLYLYMVDLLQNKTDDLVEFINKQEDLISIAQKRLDEYEAYLKARQNKVKSIQNYCLACMNKLGTDSFSGSLHEVKKRKPTKIVSITNKDAIPPEFIEVKTEIVVDKNKLKAALKNGDIEGAELIDSPNVSLIFSLKRN